MKDVYTKPFQLVLTPDRASNRTYEPGETVTLSYKVTNNGQAPSPSEDILLKSENNSDICVLSSGKVSGNIAGDTSHLSTTPVMLHINAPNDSEINEHPYEKEICIVTKAMNTFLDCHASSTQTLHVKSPVQLAPQCSHFSVLHKNEIKFEINVQNVSEKRLGSLSGQQVRVSITSEENPLATDNLIFSTLDATSESKLDFKAFYPPDEVLKTTTYQVNLYLNSVNNEPMLVQQQKITVHPTEAYIPNKKNNFLLVTNSRISPKTLEYWQNLLKNIAGKNVSIGIWDTAYYGLLDLNRSSLLTDTSHGTIIVLDNSFTTKTNLNPRRSSQYITQAQVLEANVKHDTSIIVIGESMPSTPPNEKPYDSRSDSQTIHESLEELIKALLHEDPKKEVLLHNVSRLNLRTCSVEEVNNTLQQVFPNRHYHVSTNSNFTNILVRRLADSLDSGMKYISLSEQEIENATFNEATTEKRILDSLSFSQKLSFLTQIDYKNHPLLIGSIIKELLIEQNNLCQTKTFGSFWKRLKKTYQHDFTFELNKLNQLLTTLQQFVDTGDFTNFDAWSPLITRIIAEVQYHAEQHSSFFDKILGFVFEQPKEEVRKSSLDLCSQAQALLYKIAPNELPTNLKKETKRLELGTKLEHYVKTNQSSVGFFSKRISLAEIEVAEILQQICTLEVNQDSLTAKHLSIIEQSNFLKPLYSSFRHLFPEAKPFCYEEIDGIIEQAEKGRPK